MIEMKKSSAELKKLAILKESINFESKIQQKMKSLITVNRQ